ncbi:MAG TPA: autotransporter-associated beta strand repeat-containing protein, partial [Opitutales bacterium]|nr:autotransporter-associated beta strand repeat-containing protein [Opitutales bacterium]
GNLVFGTVTNATLGELNGDHLLTLTNAGSSAVALTIGANDGDGFFTGSINGTGNLTKVGNGTLTLSGGVANFTGGVVVNGGTLTLGGTNNWGGTTSIGANGTLNLGDFSNDFTLPGTGNVSNNGTFNYNEALGNTVTYAGVVSGSGNTNYNGTSASVFENFGTGSNITSVSTFGTTFILTGASTGTGNTTINNAIAVLQGSLASHLIVSSGAFLAGNGTINNNVEMDGSFSPGINQTVNYATVPHKGSKGTAVALVTTTINGNLTWNSDGSQINYFHLSGTDNTSDKVVVNGNISYFGAGDIEFDFQDTGFFNGVSGTVYTLLTSNTDLTTIGLTAANFHAINVGPGGSYDNIGQSYFLLANGGKNLEFIVVPEPAAWGLMAGGLMLLLGLRRKRQAKLAATATTDDSEV